jgi:hypothetical protein
LTMLAKIKNSASPKRWPPKNGQSKYSGISQG